VADIFGAISALILIMIIGTYQGMWHCIVVAGLNAHSSVLARLFFRLRYKKRKSIGKKMIRKNTAIVGAGQLGSYLASDLRSNANSTYNPLFFFDHDEKKIGNTISGLQVYDEDLAKQYIEKYAITHVIIAIADAGSERVTDLYYFYSALGCEVRIFDSLLNDEKNRVPMKMGGIRSFEIEDLLFRKPISLKNEQTLRYYSGKTIMVTGGGGSIGSELCRQIACCFPKKMIILDNYENNAYDIQQELLRKYPDAFELIVEIASVQDVMRLEAVFRNHKPEVVFHAAAHKHVPLMEYCGYEAIKNNIFGTYNTVRLAEQYDAEKFILISSDKAVNPTNVMGATKRMCEMIVQSYQNSKTSFSLVRFGNVLGSNGSVIPLFQKQIADGGPITITDKRIIRYFMTIREASQLVIQAGAMADRGELFVLDMGKPVKIYDLALNMIKLSGLEPYVDIQIKEIGLRPGEKLYEELLIKTEKLSKTENDMIFTERDTPLSRTEIEEKLIFLRNAIAQWDAGGNMNARAALMKVVPNFFEPEDINKDVTEDAEECLPV